MPNWIKSYQLESFVRDETYQLLNIPNESSLSKCKQHPAIKIFNLLLSRFMTKIETGTAVQHLKILRSFKFMLDEWISLFFVM